MLEVVEKSKAAIAKVTAAKKAAATRARLGGKVAGRKK